MPEVYKQHNQVIPNKTVYFMLSYVWNNAEYAQKMLKTQEVKAWERTDSDHRTLKHYFTFFLIQDLNNLIKKGLNRDYVGISEIIRGVKGKIDFSNSVKKNLFSSGKVACLYDNYSANILENKIIKYTLNKLLFDKETKPAHKQSIKNIWLRFSNVDCVQKINMC